MPRPKNQPTWQIYAEITEKQFVAIEQAVERKYPGAKLKRAQFIREAVAAAVRAQGVEWDDK